MKKILRFFTVLFFFGLTNCSDIKNELGFEISMKVPDGIKEIKRVIQEQLIRDPEDQKYYNNPHE